MTRYCHASIDATISNDRYPQFDADIAGLMRQYGAYLSSRAERRAPPGYTSYCLDLSFDSVLNKSAFVGAARQIAGDMDIQRMLKGGAPTKDGVVCVVPTLGGFASAMKCHWDYDKKFNIA